MVQEPAVLGGAPAVTGRLGSAWPVFGDAERAALLTVLESGRWWRGGERDSASAVSRFEDAFAAFQDARHGIAVTNGTTALECAYRAVGVEAGDEVVVPASTFIATASAALMVGGVPVFADIDPETYTVDPQAIARAITPRTRCIALVDYGGLPCDYDAVAAIARRHGLPVVADCAHAHGSQWRGVGVGALTACGTFSFQMGKTLTTGEGGMVLTNDERLAELLYSHHNIGRVSGRPFYEHRLAASNLRMSEWQGALGLAQLARLPEQVGRRDRNGRRLAALLAQADCGVRPLRLRPEVTRWCFYLWHCRFQPERWAGLGRNGFVAALRAEGIPAGTGHLEPLYRNPVFVQGNFGRKGFPVAAPYHASGVDYAATSCPQAERIAASEGVALGHATFLGPARDMDVIASTIDKLWRHRDRLARWAAGG